MPTLVKTPSGTWKAVIRKRGFPTTIKTFRTKRDADDWARTTEDEMVRGLFIRRGPSERMTFEVAMKRYLAEVTPTKRPMTQRGEVRCAKPLVSFFGKYALAGITPEMVANYRDERLAGDDRASKGKPQPRAANTVRVELALLGHLFTIAIKEWGIGLVVNPVRSIRRPTPSPGRNRRLREGEEKRLMAAVAAHSNPMLQWIVTLAIETGMRSSEIVTLRRGQVNLPRRVVTLVETKNTTLNRPGI
jgi:integrase